MDSTATPNSSATLRSDELSSTSNDTYDTVKSEDVNEDEAVNNVESREEDREERPLDSSEVIELQAFVKHKEWIESKIKVLEALPPLDIFAGVDELEHSFGRTSTLSTRVQLDAWIKEHDEIERETEILDSGDIKKLKALTKAATQRNLSAEDTDLIEITLATLFGLDRLTHLLRDRSESLDLFDLRLTWEDDRISSYACRQSLLSNIDAFLKRARWKVESSGPISLNPGENERTLPEQTTTSSTNSSLTDDISREWMRLSSSITSLKQSRVASSGKILDEIIELSRKSVPDAMLDEQDRIEKLCDQDLASLSRFMQQVVSQFKRAEQVHSNMVEDTRDLQLLTEHVQQASQTFPSKESEEMFSKKLVSITSRYQSRLDSLSPSKFPMPTHSLFQEQEAFNKTLLSQLSNDNRQIQVLLRKAETIVRAYHDGCEAIKAVDVLREELRQVQEKVNLSAERLKNGIGSENGEGVPPDFTQIACVRAPLHTSYLAMLPTFVSDSSLAEEAAKESIKRSRVAALRLNVPGVDQSYRKSFGSTIDALDAQLKALETLKRASVENAMKLRIVRQMWSVMDTISNDLRYHSSDVGNALLRHRWKQQIGGEHAPPTPESPREDLNSDRDSINVFEATIQDAMNRMNASVGGPLSEYKDTLPPTLHEYIMQRKGQVDQEIADLRAMNGLLINVRHQASVMSTIRDEVHGLEDQIDNTRQEYDDLHSRILKGNDDSTSEDIDKQDIEMKCSSLSTRVESHQSEVQKLIDSLPTRIPFISQHSNTSTSQDHTHELSRKGLIKRLTFDPSAVDRAVRNDSNAFASRLSGGVNSLVRKRSLNEIYRLARDIDGRYSVAHAQLSVLEDMLRRTNEEYEELCKTGTRQMMVDDSSLSLLEASLSKEADNALNTITQHISAIHGMLDKMRMSPYITDADDPVMTHALHTRVGKVDELDLSHRHSVSNIEALQSKIAKSKKSLMLPTLQEESPMKPFPFTLAASPTINDRTPTRKRPGLMDDDIFGSQMTPVQQVFDKESLDVLSRVRSLRKRLKSIGINGAVRPSGTLHRHSSSFTLPSQMTANEMSDQFNLLDSEVVKLPENMANTAANTELRSLRLEMDASRELLDRVHLLACLQAAVATCDTQFSEFLDHIDSYPNQPQSDGSMLPSSSPSMHMLPGDSLNRMLSLSREAMDQTSVHFSLVSDDPRAIAENERLKQTWTELSEMALEKLSGRSSNTGSVSAHSDTGDETSASSKKSEVEVTKKKKHYSNLSVSGQAGPSTPIVAKKRAASAATSTSTSTPRNAPTGKANRPTPRVSSSTPKAPTPRSVSGPSRPSSPPKSSAFKSSLNTTFASRQRTSSLASNVSSSISSGRSSITSSRRMSSAISEAARSTTPTSTRRGSWARAPRMSFSSLQRETTPERALKSRSKYVANPKNKLDVALGDVINNLSVDINVEAVADTYQDKSGKYWIGGEEDPKLCFCRILRSQTVMVRVGGGWVELSRFIKNHFADRFRVVPVTPPRPGSKEKWINATSLKSMDSSGMIRGSPGSPDSIGRHLPSFALSSPDGSRHSGSPKSGSPLTPLQFIRRADVDASELSYSSIALSNGLSDLSNQSRSPSIRPRKSFTNIPSKAAWRP